jgi:hypothetical protein
MRSNLIITGYLVTTSREVLVASSSGTIFWMSFLRSRLERLLDDVKEILASLKLVMSYCQGFERRGAVRLPVSWSFTRAALLNVPVKRDRQMSSMRKFGGDESEVACAA